MKMLVVIVQDNDLAPLLGSLNKNGFSVTKLASTGGFLRTGNTTLLIGTQDERVDSALHCIEATCKSRTMLTHDQVHSDVPDVTMNMEVVVGGATVFILDVAQFFHA